MKVSPSEYKFRSKNNEIAIIFLSWWHETMDRSAYYCTISVKSDDGKYVHYHDGVVLNPHDKYNQRTGYFQAFKKALKQRWVQRYRDVDDDLVCSWMEYYQTCSHFLAAMMDGKVVEDGNDLYPL